MNQNLKLNVEKLQVLLPKLKASDAQFASNLIASFKKYGGLTPKQEPWIEKLIARATPVVAPVFQQLAAEVEVGDFAGALKLFAEAKTHLKFPKIRLQVEGTKVILALNGEKSKKPGHVTVKGEGSYPNYTFYGSVSPEGVFTPAHATYGAFKTALIKLLTDLAANPARVAKDYAKLTGNCCFCGKDIGYGKEVRSVLVGFGPDCAEHYGLKGEWLAAAEKAEAKASVAAPKLSVQDEVIESLVAQQQAVIDQYSQLPAENLPKFTVFASYPSQADAQVAKADAVLAAEAQHEAAYEAEIKTKDDAFWSSVGTSITGGYWEEIKNGEVTAKIVPGPVVPEAAEKPEWVKAFQEGAVAAGLDSVAFQTGPATEAYWEAADQANKAQAAKLEVLSQSLLFQNQSLLFQKVPVDAYQALGIEWKDTGGESVEPVVEVEGDGTPLTAQGQPVGITVSEVEAGWAHQVVDPKSALGPDYLLACPEVNAEEPGQHTCFFCEQQVDAVKILHGYQVCFTCVEQLKG